MTPLHVWSGYSPLRGPVALEKLAARAAELGHTHLALTDVNNLYGAPRLHHLAEQAGLKPIFGAEIQDGRFSVVALIENDAGYENLCRILTRLHESQQRQGFELLGLPDLPDRCGGLYLLVEDVSLAEAMLAAGLEASRLYLAIDPAAQSPARLLDLLGACRKMSLPLAASGKAMFIGPEDFNTARVLAAARCGTTRDSLPPDSLPHPRAILRDPRRLGRELADLTQAIDNNRRLVEACSGFRLLPRRPVFPRFDGPQDISPQAELQRLCREGVARRYGRSNDRIERRLERELDLIGRKGFSEYFLVVWDIVQYARRRGVPVAGRGSGASSLVAYLLGITNVCPLAFDIPFERFLNERRDDFPDLDIDFCWRIRDDVIDYAFHRWGSERTAMISTHNTFQERSAFREAAKAFGLSDEQVSDLEPADADRDQRLGQIGAVSRRMVGLLHNLSVHPGGIVIAPGAVERHVPVQPAPKGVRITQYDKDGVEEIGLVKLDLLGNRSLSTIRSACDLVRRHEGRQVDIEALPPGDPETLATLRNAETIGCNQIESPAMRHLLRAMQPRDVRGLMRALALIRPGAASIGMKETFIRRCRGLEDVRKTLAGQAGVDRILADTHGIMLYEDDVMLVAAAMLATDLAEADRFRKAVQKCRDDTERLNLSREFLARCRSAGLDDEYVKSMWVQMAKFNAYSFCRAHAASYAMLAYASAYLKTHYPLEYWTACLNNNQSMYHPRVYVEQAKREGVAFLLPDANRSQEEFSIDTTDTDVASEMGTGFFSGLPEKVPVPLSALSAVERGQARPRRLGRASPLAIRVGFNRICGLGPAGIECILAARERRPFEGLTDFLARTGLGREEARALVLCGTFDFTGRKRPELMMELNLFFSLRPHRSLRSLRPPGQERLLMGGPTIPPLPHDYSPARKYADERKILGISVRKHIMSVYRGLLDGQVDADSRDLAGRTGRHIRIAGVLEAQRTAQTQAGQTMMFLTLDDEFDLFEVTLFPDAYSAVGALQRYGPYIVAGRVEQQYDSITVTADAVTLHPAEVA